MKKIVIKIFGTTPPCSKCKLAEKVAKELTEELKNVSVEKFDALSEKGDKYGIMVTPTIVVNDKVVAIGKVLSKEKLEDIVKNEMR